jgi:hypothetical protein
MCWRGASPTPRSTLVETVNETAADLGLEVEQMRAGRFGDLFKRLIQGAARAPNGPPNEAEGETRV